MDGLKSGRESMDLKMTNDPNKACASTAPMGIAPASSHQFRELFEKESAHSLRITFRDGDIFRFRSFRMVDPSIYSISDQWNGTVAQQIAGRPPAFRLRYPAGSMIDFVESDIAVIFDESFEKSLYVAKKK